MSAREPRRGDASLRRALEARLRREVDAEVLFDPANRARYATDASIYEIEPLGVLVPRRAEAVRAALQIAREMGVPVLPRGAGSSQCGQTVGRALVIDATKFLDRVIEVDAEGRTALVEPGVVLDALNARLRPLGLWFPVDVSTSAQATMGGMAGNNSCGARSLVYGNMVHNVIAIDAVTGAGERWRFGPCAEAGSSPSAYGAFVRWLQALYERERAEIEARFPRVLRRVAGYNLDHLGPPHENAAHLLVGSEGTLAWFERLHLKLAPLPGARALGVCQFPTLRAAMEATPAIVALGPSAVELVDRTMIELARAIDAFAATAAAVLHGDPQALLLVEFAGEEAAPLAARLEELSALVASLGCGAATVAIGDAATQRDVWELRKAGLNIMMSMKGDAKPVSFIEDCAVPLEHLGEYTARLDEIFARHGTRGTWYAHASVGCLHVRPVLDMRRDGAAKMRRIAEEAAALVRTYKGAYSGEHGDGLVRSEWIAPFFGPRLTAVLAEIKARLDPDGVMNPGKIVNPPRMDDARLFRFPPSYRTLAWRSALDWSEHESAGAAAGDGFAKAVEMCNNNGHCRKFDAGTMCPSYRATRDERDSTRGRANTLRWVLTGRLPLEAALEALELCVGCKGCRSECPTGVDMARMKIEVLAQRRSRLTWRERAIAYLPRYAPLAARVPGLANALQAFAQRALGFAPQRSLPRWCSDRFVDRAAAPRGDREVVLLVDCFDRYFEPENARAALRVLEAAGYRVHVAEPVLTGRPLCCGRTFLACGRVEEARAEARRVLDAVGPWVRRGVSVIGLEPACLYTLRDEYLALVPGVETRALAAAALGFEEFVAREAASGRFASRFAPVAERALVHAHCHQKAFGAVRAVEATLRLVPGLRLERVPSSCCGMAGAFGLEAEHYAISMKMAEAALLPAVRAAASDTLVVATGTSCRQQIGHGAGRPALHPVRVLEAALGSR